jgi:hypothetical protein
MYANGKMIPVETVPQSGKGGWKTAAEVVNSSMIYLIHCKNFCKYYNVPPLSTTIIKKENLTLKNTYKKREKKRKCAPLRIGTRKKCLL